ncbi:MAG: TonB-dependent receptor, partial [Dysgonamonadaceae bacterium]|nr:TonB-dependent receptor [Dysgonamonadaceae bacterium]
MKITYLVIGLLIFSQIQAQSLEKDTLMLDEVVVEAKSPVKRVRESAFNVVAIDVQSLHNTAASVSNALDRVSGVKIRETGGIGSQMQINLNGFSGR